MMTRPTHLSNYVDNGRWGYPLTGVHASCEEKPRLGSSSLGASVLGSGDLFKG